MARYPLSVWHDEEYVVDLSGEDMQRIGAQLGALNEELAAAGADVFGGGLQPASSATVLRSDNGEVSMTNGPDAQTKEQMGRFWVIEADDFDDALAWARKATLAYEGPAELRAFQSE